MYKRILEQVHSKEDEEDFYEWNQMYVQQELDNNQECYSCELCNKNFGKTEYELNAHIQSASHLKLVKQFQKKYNQLIKQYKNIVYSKPLGRKLKKVSYFKAIYEYK